MMKKLYILTILISLTGWLGAQYTIQKVDIVRVSTPIAMSVSGGTVSISGLVNVTGSTVIVSGLTLIGSTVCVTGSTVNVAGLVNVTGSTVIITQPVDVSGSMVDVTGSVVSDSRYYGRVSTGSGGLVNASGNITINGYSVEKYSFYSSGGDSTVTNSIINGTLYALDGIPTGQSFSVAVSSPVVFQCTLPAGTTLYWETSGVK